MKLTESELRSLPGVAELLDRAHDLQVIQDEHIRMSSWRQLVHEADEAIETSILKMQFGQPVIESAQKAFRLYSCVLSDLFCRIPIGEIKTWEAV